MYRKYPSRGVSTKRYEQYGEQLLHHLHVMKPQAGNFDSTSSLGLTISCH